MKLYYRKHNSPNACPMNMVDSLGIKYAYFEDNPKSDVCVFHGVSKVPYQLPEYITRAK